MRFTDQDKDAGRYSQAEQVTWEVAGILPAFLSFAVDKYDRFIAAKLFAETLLTSGAAAATVACRPSSPRPRAGSSGPSSRSSRMPMASRSKAGAGRRSQAPRIDRAAKQRSIAAIPIGKPTAIHSLLLIPSLPAEMMLEILPGISMPPATTRPKRA